MGRMFRVISEGGPDRNGGAVALAEAVPFVEIGGPDGVVSSAPTPAPRVVPRAEPVAVARTEEPRALSVAFHHLPKAGRVHGSQTVAADLVAFHFPDHPVSEEYRAVREEIRRQFEDSAPRIVLFAAAAASAGTTTVVLNFAATLVQESGAKVLIVDANLSRPRVAERLGLSDSPGLAEVLSQTTPLAWAVQPSPVANVHVLPAGAVLPTTPTAMAEDFPRLLGQLRQWFGWVLIDGGVWGEAGGSEAVGSATDAVYLVSRHADIERPEFTGLRGAVAESGGTVRGYITTR